MICTAKLGTMRACHKRSFLSVPLTSYKKRESGFQDDPLDSTKRDLEAIRNQATVTQCSAEHIDSYA
jgi:hypothetical protein